jgi:hypothetical protein
MHQEDLASAFHAWGRWKEEEWLVGLCNRFDTSYMKVMSVS